MPRRFSKGFTLIELLITVTIIGILAGILISILSPEKQRQRAQDGVRAGNIAKLAQALEAYNAAEGSYPATQLIFNPVGGGGYVQNWPAAGTGYSYTYFLVSGVGCLSVQMATNTAQRFLYVTSNGTSYLDSTGAVAAGRIMRNCTSVNACVAAAITSSAGCRVI